MDANELRALQAPLKKQYREQPGTALTLARAEAMLDVDRLACGVRSWGGETDAGLHPATGGDGSLACSADMLLEALVACAGVTVSAVATAMGVSLCRCDRQCGCHRDGREAAGREGCRGGPLGRARHAGRGSRSAGRPHRYRADLRIGHRRRCRDGAASRRDERAFLRHLPNLARAASTYSYPPDRS